MASVVQCMLVSASVPQMLAQLYVPCTTHVHVLQNYNLIMRFNQVSCEHAQLGCVIIDIEHWRRPGLASSWRCEAYAHA